MNIVLGSGLSGTVTEFDAGAGMGTIADSSGRTWPFHCVSIADGTRMIAVGARVTFSDGLHIGRHEAVEIRPA